MTNETEKHTEFGSPSTAGEMERNVVVASPRRDGACYLVRMDVSPRHGATIAKQGFPGHLYDDYKGLCPLGGPLKFGRETISFPRECGEEVVSGFAFGRELRMVGVCFRIMRTVGGEGVVSSRERHVACLDCTSVERPWLLFTVVPQYRGGDSVSRFVHLPSNWGRYRT